MKKLMAVLVCALLLTGVALAESTDSDEKSQLSQGIDYLRQITNRMNQADDEPLCTQGIDLLKKMDDPDSVNVAVEVFSSLPGTYNSSNYFKMYAQALQDLYAARYSEAAIRLDILSGDADFTELLASYSLTPCEEVEA